MSQEAGKKYYKAESKKEWYVDGTITDERLQLGCLMRIADATEKMAGNYIALQNERDRYSKYYQQELGYNKSLRVSNSNLKGQITKLKKALAASKVSAEVVAVETT